MNNHNSVYTRLGVRRVVNGLGATTLYGGIPPHPQVVEAMAEAAAWRVDLPELLAASGQRIAELVHAPAAYITTGAAGGLLLATAACVAGTDPRKIVRLPDTTGMKNEVVIQRKQRMNFDHAVRGAGVRLVEVGWSHASTAAWEMEAEITERTAAVLHAAPYETYATLSLADVIPIAHARDVPVIVDAAPCLPPVSNLWAYTQLGAALVSFSGGKAIGGPQGTGIILGRPDLIAACAANAGPSPNTVGRPLKVSKEEIVGLVVALELYLGRDHDQDQATWRQRNAAILAAIAHVPNIVAWEEPFAQEFIPIPEVRLRPVATAAKGWLQSVVDRLAEGEPSIRVGTWHGAISISPHAIDDDEVPWVADRLAAVLAELPAPRPA